MICVLSQISTDISSSGLASFKIALRAQFTPLAAWLMMLIKLQLAVVGDYSGDMLPPECVNVRGGQFLHITPLRENEPTLILINRCQLSLFNALHHC